MIAHGLRSGVTAVVELDELTRRERALRAERLRPEKPVTTEDLLGELIAALDSLFRTPPDKESR